MQITPTQNGNYKPLICRPAKRKAESGKRTIKKPHAENNMRLLALVHKYYLLLNSLIDNPWSTMDHLILIR